MEALIIFSLTEAPSETNEINRQFEDENDGRMIRKQLVQSVVIAFLINDSYSFDDNWLGADGGNVWAVITSSPLMFAFIIRIDSPFISLIKSSCNSLPTLIPLWCAIMKEGICKN